MFNGFSYFRLNKNYLNTKIVSTTFETYLQYHIHKTKFITFEYSYKHEM